MIKATSVDSLTNFQKNAKQYAELLGESKEPVVLTVNGKAKLVVQDAAAYQAMIDKFERAQFLDAIRESLKQSDLGMGRPAEDVYNEMKLKYGL